MSSTHTLPVNIFNLEGGETMLSRDKENFHAPGENRTRDPASFCQQVDDWTLLRWLNTVLAVCEYMSFARSWQEKGCSSKAETWQVKNMLMKDYD